MGDHPGMDDPVERLRALIAGGHDPQVLANGEPVVGDFHVSLNRPDGTSVLFARTDGRWETGVITGHELIEDDAWDEDDEPMYMPIVEWTPIEVD